MAVENSTVWKNLSSTASQVYCDPSDGELKVRSKIMLASFKLMFDVSIPIPGLNAPPLDTVVQLRPRRSMAPSNGFTEQTLEMIIMMSGLDTGGF